MQYKVITHENLGTLEELVNEALAQDWLPCGGLMSYYKPGQLTRVFAQALSCYGSPHGPASGV